MNYLNKEQSRLMNEMANRISILTDEKLMDVIAGMAKKKDVPEYEMVMGSLLGEYTVRNGNEKANELMDRIGW